MRKEKSIVAKSDDENTALRVIKPQLLQVQTNAQAAQANLLKAQFNLANIELRSVTCGRINSVHVGRGQYIDSDNSVSTFYSMNTLYVRLPISDEDLNLIDPSVFCPSAKAEGSANGTKKNNCVKALTKSGFSGKSQNWMGVIQQGESSIECKTRL